MKRIIQSGTPKLSYLAHIAAVRRTKKLTARGSKYDSFAVKDCINPEQFSLINHIKNTNLNKCMAVSHELLSNVLSNNFFF